MPHIRLIDEDEAEGLLREEYRRHRLNAGKVFNIVKAMSLRPKLRLASKAPKTTIPPNGFLLFLANQPNMKTTTC